TMDNLKLTATSTSYLNAGDSFCHASAAGSGNTVSVTCAAPINDARYYFADPTAFYALANSDCKGRGTRVSDGVDPGCYDIQVQGACGVRTLPAVAANSVTFGGAPCSWNSGAMVHIPWSGSAPDIGALEFGGAASVPAPSLISVEPLP